MKAVRAAWWIWALVPFLVVSCLLLTSCAAVEHKAEPMKGVCILKPIGQTDEGAAVMAYYCEPR